MSRFAGMARRLATGLAVLSLGAGLAVASAGTAQANVPNDWGFAYVNDPSTAGIPVLSHQAGSWPSAFHVHVKPIGAGRVLVIFPHIASKNGVVHVTAVAPGPFYCQVQSWAEHGLAENVVVQCYKAGGAATFVPFTVMYTTSSKGPFGGGYGYVHFEPGHGVLASFNSAGGTNSVTAAGTGAWVLTMGGIGISPAAGGVQVTAVNAKRPARCEVALWKSEPVNQVITVRCFNRKNVPLETGWNLSYQDDRAITGAKPRWFAYTVNNKPALSVLYAPLPTGINFSSAGAVNHILRIGTGLWKVGFPMVGALPDTVLVSGLKVGPGFCNLNGLWKTLPTVPEVKVNSVACYTYTGVRENVPSLITYMSAVS
jgi:hypothetical protein